MSVEGVWDRSISTPIGRIEAVVELTLTGTSKAGRLQASKVTGQRRGAHSVRAVTEL